MIAGISVKIAIQTDKTGVIAQAIADALNEAGDKTRTQLQRAVQKQAGFLKYKGVTDRVTTLRAFAPARAKTGLAAFSVATDGMRYSMIFRNKPPAKISEFRVQLGAHGVEADVWGATHRFKRSFMRRKAGAKLWLARLPQADGNRANKGGRGVKAARSAPHGYPIRRLYGPSVAGEVVKGDAARTFHTSVAEYLPISINRKMARALE